jgi:subtilisin family serine protease
VIGFVKYFFRFTLNTYFMKKNSILLLLGCLCMVASNTFAQRYFRMDHGTQINFHASDTRFVATAREPIAGPINLSSGIRIDSVKALGKAGFSLLRVNQKTGFTTAQLHKAGKQSGRFNYITPLLLTEDGQEIGSLTDRLMVKLKDNVDIGQLNGLLSQSGATISGKYEFDRNVYFVQLRPDSVNYACEIAWRFFQTGFFKYAEPDYLLFIKKATNDPFFNNQWAINNTGQSGGTANSDMRVLQAWGMTMGCPAVTVAVVDEGVDLTHPDLQANLLPGFDATGGGSNGGADANSPHGTSCAGIIGAVADNGIGVTGIAPRCHILPVRGMIAGTGLTADLAAGIDWAWQNGADVISCSWGSNAASANIEQAITNAVTLGRGGLGTVVCVATGNDNSSIRFPASDEDVIAVGASTPCDTRKLPSSCDGETNWGSNFGTGLDVVAPGVKIYTTDLQGSNGYNTNGGTNGDYYNAFNGTSAATPHVAATIALIFSINPNLTGVQARQILESTAYKVSGYTYSNTAGQPNGTWNNEVGYGRVNANAALQAANPIIGPAAFCGNNTTATYTFTGVPANQDVTWTVSIGLQITSGQHTPTVTVAGVSTGNQTLTAATNVFPCAVSKPVVVNAAPIVVGGYYNPGQIPLSTSSINNVCNAHPTSNITTDMTYLNNPTSITWGGLAPTGVSWAQVGNNIAVTFKALNQSASFWVDATNACGTDEKEYGFKTVVCTSAAAAASDYTIQVSPNPVSGMLRITSSSTVPEQLMTKNKPAVTGIRAVSFYDLAGRLVKKFEYSNMPQQVNVNTAGFHPGVYIVELFNGTSTSRKKIIIQK